MIDIQSHQNVERRGYIHKNMYSTRSWFKHNAPAVDSMLHNCLQDLIRLLHFVDDWEIEDDNWNDMFHYSRYDNNDNGDTAVFSCLLCEVWIDQRRVVCQEMATVHQVWLVKHC